MSIPGGIRVKLALALLGIVGGALLAAYAIVVPSLERRLVAAKLNQLQGDAALLAVNYAALQAQNNPQLGGFVDQANLVANARVVLFGIAPGTGELVTLADSSTTGSPEIQGDPVGLQAARSVSTVRARVRHDGREYAEVAVPLLAEGNVLLLSSSLSDQLATVALVKRRLLFATVAALLIAVVLGFPVAAVHARRLGRLQRAAERIAEGAFDEPVVDDGNDEVGQLAASFDRMRIQLAQLDSARKEFVANASHELRTPLFSLAGFLELLADEDLDDDTRREFIATTRSQVERLTTARHRPARPLAHGRGPDPDRARRGRPGRGRPRRRRRLRGARRRLRPHARRRRRRRRLGVRGRGAGAADRPLARRQRAHPHARRAPPCGSASSGAAAASPSSSPTTGPGSRPSTSTASSSASTGSRVATPRAAGSASRSRGSWPAGWAGASRSRAAPARPRSRSTCPAVSQLEPQGVAALAA